jgi:NADH-quinone oxidoreductase subunit H
VTDTLFDLYLSVVEWFLSSLLLALEHMGLEGGWLHRFIAWLATEAAVWITATIAAIVLVLWTGATAALAAWADRRARAMVEGRSGPRHVGAGGLLQGLADWLKLFLKRRGGTPSALATAVSGAMVLAALALLPLGPWMRLADPEWGLLVATVLIALSTLPMAVMAPEGRRRAHVTEAATVGVVLLLSIAPLFLIAGSASADAVVGVQEGWGWGVVMAPLGCLAFMVVMCWEAGRLARLRVAVRSREGWPGPHSALGRYVLAARYLSLGLLGALVFLAGWWSPVAPGMWWTLLKAYGLVLLASFSSAVLPLGQVGDTAWRARRTWMPVAALDLVVVAVVLEVMA